MLTIPHSGPHQAASGIDLPASPACPEEASRSPVYRFGECEVHPVCRKILVRGMPRKLQPRPFDLLVYLIEHRNRTLSIDELLNAVWHEREVQVGSVAAAIARIRAALCERQGGTGAFIQTSHRFGYRFVAALDDVAHRA
ncbi:DNA-binding winged helix-turn-helix (wHTH) protein [Pelomonas saccharophila]|uniref:DNA-binding winged helix-turn-helix (WHTH) protein n=1 Tax=Roseateles saccharophilus TaxID=304 RepID=A0ABU1YSZ7_ROSSA|nr:winged helix-turn-helix domain-containing protein [Roseateles saccharophilus]MDR7271326.1 DNA-binding winged helix-turn-helix (wHTH) protein [Roseateles saccharophilus]